MSLEKIDAIEERISKVVELVKGLKDEKKRLEEEAALLRMEVQDKKALEDEAARLRQEKDQVKDRLEQLLKGIESLAL